MKTSIDTIIDMMVEDITAENAALVDDTTPAETVDAEKVTQQMLDDFEAKMKASIDERFKALNTDTNNNTEPEEGVENE